MYKKGKMVIVKETLSYYKEDYQKALNHFKQQSITDPLNVRYHSLNAGKDLLLGMQKNLDNALASILAAKAEDGKEAFTYKVLLAFVQKDLGTIYDIMEEPTHSEKYFKRCIKLIEPLKMYPELVIPYIGALNGLGNVLAAANKSQEAIKLLQISERVYKDFKASGNAEAAMSITDLFGISEELGKEKGSDELEGLYTQRTFYIAQVYSHLKELDKFTIYCHKGLRRQLNSNSYEPINLATNVANLSKSFLVQNMFKESRHHLALATWITAEYETKMITPEMSEATIDDVKETFKRHHADLARCWAKYGLALLDASQKRIFLDNESKSMIDNMQNLRRIKMYSIDFRFPNPQLEVYENRVSTEFCLGLDDAKLLFKFVVNWLDQAKAYYKLDTKPTVYAGIIKDYAELYKKMSFFQENLVNQVKMLNRSARWYEELIDALNPTDYLGICRECWSAAGVGYYVIVEIFNIQKNPSPSLLEKMSQVCRKAIKNFLEFQKSYMEHDCITLKPHLSTEIIHEVISSHYYLGSLYYKMIMPDPDPALQLENMVNSYKYNKRFTDACKKYKEAAATLKKEIHISQQLVAQLPLKIQDIQKRL